MSEERIKKTMPMPEGGGRKAITMKEFYRICETLKAHADEFLRDRPDTVETMVRLSKLTGLDMGKTTVTKAKQATGVEWTAPSGRKSAPELQDPTAIRTLAFALIGLYRKLGEEAPPDLKLLFHKLSILDTETQTVTGLNNGELIK